MKFVDPLMLMRILRTEAKRRVSNVIAAASMKRSFVGTVSGWLGSIPVGRALDLAKSGDGKIHLPRPYQDPLLVRGIGTNFEEQAQKGGLLVLPKVDKTAAQAEIAEIISPQELRLKKEFNTQESIRQLTGLAKADQVSELKMVDKYEGTSYKVAPKVDHSKAFEAVFSSLKSGGCICIFPEGGSHDRTELLPLKGKCVQATCSLIRLI